MERRLWTRDEMILVLNLYLKIPFGKMDARNPEVKRMAKLIGRSANAVALRLVNYAACDPKLKSRGIKGMEHGSKDCKVLWEEFADNQEQLMFESEQILARYEGVSIEKKFENEIRDIPKSIVGKEKERLVRTRVNQSLFRIMVLSNYDGQCALTGIDIPDLLVASHIIPWAKNENERLNPQNGICLSALYDRAFDSGLISFDDSQRVIFSDKLMANCGKDYYAEHFETIKGKALSPTLKYNINPQFLEWHRDCIFNK